MKRCPKCASSFPDSIHFCEFDGARLVADYLNSDQDWSDPHEEAEIETSAGDALLAVDYSDTDLDRAAPHEEQPPQTNTSAAEYHVPDYMGAAPPRRNSQLLSLMLLAGVVAAVAVGLLVFIVYQRMSNEAPLENSNESPNVAVTQQQAPQLPSHPSPSVSESPSPTPSPSPIATPSPSESLRVALSSTEVSTGGIEKSRRGPVTIQLTNGTTVEADEAWETGEGIWYRHRNVVTLLERKQVKAIEKPTPASSPSSTPATSPTANP